MRSLKGLSRAEVEYEIDALKRQAHELRVASTGVKPEVYHERLRAYQEVQRNLAFSRRWLRRMSYAAGEEEFLYAAPSGDAVWRDLPDTQIGKYKVPAGRYRVSNDGFVRMKGKDICLSRVIVGFTPYIRLSTPDRAVCACRLDKLVAQAWLPTPAEGEVLQHIDRCAVNCRADNLRWGEAD